MNKKNEVEFIEQYWKPQLIDNCQYPFLVVDNWYTPNELDAVWKELNFLQSQPREDTLRAANTAVARDKKTGKSLAESYRYYLDAYYHIRTLSPILNCTYKQRTKEFHKFFENMAPYARSFYSCNRDSTMISYYEHNDYYDAHWDCFLWTCLIWVYKEPKQFEGGDLILEDVDTEIKLKNNRMLMFPSCYKHAVTPLKSKSNKQIEFGSGRFCITHFYYSIPGKFDKDWNFIND